MLNYLGSYIQPIMVACALFPFIAGCFTLPFIVKHYRKFGGIAIMRTIVVYSFILYLMCAFLLTVLPLPSKEAVLAMPDHHIGWIPFKDLYIGMQKVGLNSSTITDLGVWKKFLTSSDFFQVLFNIVMTIPLGIYLRYYFRFTLRETILMGFCASLFFEVTQYSALYGIYPKPYRYTEVDDLINNTLGAVIGYAIQPLVCIFFPTRDEIDQISYKKGEHLTVMRRFFGFVLDVVLSNFIFALLEIFVIPKNMVEVPISIMVWSSVMIAYFMIFPCITKGRTLGQIMVKLRTVSEDGNKAKFRQIVGRNILLYAIEFFMFYLSGLLAITYVSVVFVFNNTFQSMMIVSAMTLIPLSVMLFFILRCLKKYNVMPHSHFSHTKEVAYGRKKLEPEIANE